MLAVVQAQTQTGTPLLCFKPPRLRGCSRCMFVLLLLLMHVLPKGSRQPFSQFLPIHASQIPAAAADSNLAARGFTAHHHPSRPSTIYYHPSISLHISLPSKCCTCVLAPIACYSCCRSSTPCIKSATVCPKDSQLVLFWLIKHADFHALHSIAMNFVGSSRGQPARLKSYHERQRTQTTI